MMKIENIFTPYYIGKCRIPNRLVVPAMVANMCPDGNASEQYIRYHEEKAKGGWGLIITEDYRINEHAAGYPAVAALYDESQIPSHKRFTDIIHQYDTKVFCQIYHAGRQANHRVNGGVRPVSCSPVPCPWNKEIPRELTVEEIRQLVKDFGATALNAQKAGFDGIEIHAAHGYLIHEFLSPNCNHRIDEYGGTYINRMRFLKEIMEEVRKQVGDDFPISVRFSAQENTEGGRRMFESRQMLMDIEEMGADVIHLSNGMYGIRSSIGIVASFFQQHGWNMDLAAEAKSFLKIPVITVGRISEPAMAEDIIASGKADFVAMGRASLADPYWPNKAKAAADNDIRHCIGCLQGCTASTYQGVPIYCLVNPELGHEFEYDYSKAKESKTIYVAGAGIAGMEAARAAAIKGHRVEIFEKKNTVGGQFISAAYPPFKGEFTTYTAWLFREIKKYGNITLHLNTELTVDMVKDGKPDKVILASGAQPVIPNVPGIHNKNVVLAEDVLLGQSDTGMNVLVVGGGMVGSETAAYLGAQCKSKVTLVELRDAIAMDLEAGIRDDLKDCLRRCYVEIMTNTSIAGVTDEGALLKRGDDITLFPCDTVVLAIGTKAWCPLAEALKGNCEVTLVGDAVKARQAIQASAEGFAAGLAA
ncbi:FAD-dependent oxidoreductase [Brenneria goodwinii]|uniref:oxidoreductase n=2 Tax=Brenneria goodwinii TaxID=1109412 RepID=UPI001EFB3F32|nr:FAD-dependent oxidoreductase [Brenneria goodwinii]MCG8156385.1 FAD-dependent oxidoreductase [Brenneria goodwinii]MCG8160876.1 FAD-dependent oxidoreductase [Brenneria goodwinii]MCG8166189.1 FAD-dependent oxidoreductase [Brenneria goodwinii]MCG8169713.1 FAD-dependent oxidoreductase [Brenneria goodwinii]MCG8179331.1 FAD-dependent oxidoreductase [Brenneria goodwinii]